MFSNPTIIRAMKNVYYRGYPHDESKSEVSDRDSHHTDVILDSFKFKRLEKLRETIAERVKLMPQKKNGNRNQNPNSKQIINQALCR